MRGFSRFRFLFAGAALVLAAAGAWGWGLGVGADERPTVLLDASASCAAANPDGARRFEHSDLRRALREAVSGGARHIQIWTDGVDTSGENPLGETPAGDGRIARPCERGRPIRKR